MFSKKKRNFIYQEAFRLINEDKERYICNALYRACLEKINPHHIFHEFPEFAKKEYTRTNKSNLAWYKYNENNKRFMVLLLCIYETN